MATKKRRQYKNLKALAEAFASGELDRKQYQLVLDNDCSWLIYVGPLPKGVKRDSKEEWEFRDRMNDECRQWFSGNGYADLLDACDAAGIPAEWC